MANPETTGSLAEWRDGDDEFNILVTELSVARILNRKCIDLLKRWLELDGDKDDIERLIRDTREALH